MINSQTSINLSRPTSANPVAFQKNRPFSSHCPRIIKHEIQVPNENYQAFVDQQDLKRVRPQTATNQTKTKANFFSGGKKIRSALSPVSRASARPSTAPFGSFINFDFINGGSKSTGKFKDTAYIKPLKRVNTEAFHTVIYKIKQQKETLEKKIVELEAWQREFKENNIWNTPQATIVNSIMNLNAKMNPEGSVGEFLRKEREKEYAEKSKKKASRPSSAVGVIRTIKNAKSVTDFFREHDYFDVVQEIIDNENEGQYCHFSGDKSKTITEKINDYMENKQNYRRLIDSSKELIASHSKEYDDGSQAIIEEDEYTGESPANYNKGRTYQLSDLEYDMVTGSILSPTSTIAVQHSQKAIYRIDAGNVRRDDLSTKEGTVDLRSPGSQNSLTSPKGVYVIHTRPQTAKARSTQDPNVLSKELQVAEQKAGDLRDQRDLLMSKLGYSTDFSQSSAMSLKGAKLSIRPFSQKLPKRSMKNGNISMRENHYQQDQSLNGSQSLVQLNHQQLVEFNKVKKNEKSLSERVMELKFEDSDSVRNLKSMMIKHNRPRTALTHNRVLHVNEGRPQSGIPQNQTGTKLRLQSAKVKTSASTQTSEKVNMNRINIDGEYFQSFVVEESPSKKSVIKSWIGGNEQQDQQQHSEQQIAQNKNVIAYQNANGQVIRENIQETEAENVNN